MSVILRTGTYGTYYGSTYDTSGYTTQAQMEHNAAYIYSYLKIKGWTVNAIAALLGNLESESGMNPGIWEGNDVGDTVQGYGLVQWTPATKYLEWCTNAGFSDPSEMDNNLLRIVYEVTNGLQWLSTSSYPLTFKEFTKSTESADYLARAFMINYERPGDQTEENQAKRGSQGAAWYSYLSGVVPSPGIPHKKTGKFKFVLFADRLRQRARPYMRNRQ